MSGKEDKRPDEGLMMMQELEDRLKEQIDKLEHIRLSATELKDSISGNNADLKQSISDHLDWLNRLTERVETLQMNTAVFVQRERLEKLKSIEGTMKAEKEQWEKERRRMEDWLSARREETAKEAQALAEALDGIRELWGKVARCLEGEVKEAGKQMEKRWTKMEGALVRERERLREEIRGEKWQHEREREHAERVMAHMEERQVLERRVWENERESLKEEIYQKSEQVEKKWRRVRGALQEKERMVEDLWVELTVLMKREKITIEKTEVEHMEKERLKLEIWEDVELIDTERERAERAMSWEMGRMEQEIRKLRKQREAARKLMQSAVKQMDAARRQMETASKQMEIAREKVEEAVQEKECMEEELRRVKWLMETERIKIEEVNNSKRMRRAWSWPLLCHGKQED